MRITTFVVCATGVLSMGIGQHEHSKRQTSLFNWQVWLAGAGGKVADPGKVSRKETLKSEIPGAKRIKIRSGPYDVPHMGKKSFSGHAGMLQNFADTDIEKPCSGECVILRQVAGLEYANNGQNANIDTGMWLHHVVAYNVGGRRWDPVGYGKICWPLIAIASTPSKAERNYVAGNERNRIDYFQGDNLNVPDGTGYKLDKDDVFAYVIELMNMNMENKVVYMTMTYDIIDGPLPAGWKETKPVFLDASDCKVSDVHPPQETGSFTISSDPWKPNVEGKIVHVMGHLHDGGISLEVKPDASTWMCNTTTQYSGSAEYVFRGSAMGSDKLATDHISGMAGCEPASFAVKEMKRDQSWRIHGNYDYSQREGNLEKGKQSEIMAISMIIVAVEPNVRPVT